MAATGERRLLDAALSVFAERGFARATLRQIAERAGVTHGLVVHHFGTKSRLQEVVDEEVLARLEAALDAVPQPDGPGGLMGAVRSGLEVLLVDEPVLAAYLRQVLLDGGEASHRVFDRFVEIGRARFAEANDEGRLRPSGDPDAQLAVSLAAGLLPLLLPDHLGKLLGGTMASPELIGRWTRAEAEALAHGLFLDGSDA